jgi:hypothetical protein
VEEYITTIYSILSPNVLCQWPELAQAACQAARDIFETVQGTAKAVSKCQLRNPYTNMKKVLKA